MNNIVIPAPEFELKLPISGETVRYRPFLVREERMMMILKEATDMSTVVQNLKKIVNNCVLSELDTTNLSYTDFEYLFLNMRVRSMGESVDFNTECECCKKPTPVSVNLNDLCTELENMDLPENTVMLTDDIGVMVSPLKLRDAAVATQIAEKDSVQAIMVFIEKVFTKDAVYDFAETTNKEKTSFIDSLSLKHVELIMNTINSYPKLKAEIDVSCINCGENFKFSAEGLENFFTSA
tara:strand:+ start:3944 stop:4654 length:711 start_codon:yes stop_codon:yes gene_type:complete